MLRALLLAATAWCGPIEEAFLPVLDEGQLQELGTTPTAEAMARSMTAPQKAEARKRLEPLSPADREKGEALLGSFLDLYRSANEAALKQPSAEWTAAASEALAAGDNERAGRLAAEALSLDPDDDKAFGILKLSERKVAPAVIEAAALPAGFSAPRDPGPTPQALSLMGRALEARRAGDMDATLSFSLQAMRADPTSPQVQDLYRMVTADRARHSAKVRATLSYMEAAGRARDDGKLDEAVRLAEKAVQTDPDPSTLGFLEYLRKQLQERKLKEPAKPKKTPFSPVPLAPAGAALMALGAMGWRRWGGDAADKLKRDASIFAVAVGAAGVLYGGWLMAGAAAVGPGMGLIGGGTAAAVSVNATMAAEGAAAMAAGAKMTQAGYSLARPDNLESGVDEGTGSTTPETVDAYTEAKNGGRHSGHLKNYVNRTKEEIEKAYRSHLKQVKFHEQKIAHPEVFSPNWQTATPEAQRYAIQGWRDDIRRNQELADIMKGLLKERGL